MILSRKSRKYLRPPAARKTWTVSSVGCWSGKMAWDRADGKGERRPSRSCSNSDRSWWIVRLDGYLACDITYEDEMTTDAANARASVN